jgi:hypothetical protein
MRLDPASGVAGGAVDATIDDGPASMYLTIMYHWERFVSGAWQWVGEPLFFPMVVVGVPACDSLTFSAMVTPDLAPGPYRLAQSVTFRLGGQAPPDFAQQVLYADFDVVKS